MQVWAGPLSFGRIVVVLWNRGETPANITAEWNEIGLLSFVPVVVRDLWAV